MFALHPPQPIESTQQHVVCAAGAFYPMATCVPQRTTRAVIPLCTECVVQACRCDGSTHTMVGSAGIKEKGGGGIGEERGGLHECDLVCGKVLGCTEHRYEERDHKGPCGRCLRRYVVFPSSH
jgi:hypothetical protein